MSAKQEMEFLCGRAGSGKSTAVLAGIRRAIDAGRHVYLIVPDQQAVVWERRAARELPPVAALHLDIVGFARLADLVARRYGGLSYRYITKGGKAALMWSAQRTLAPTLSFYGQGRAADRAVLALLSAVSEMKRCGVTAGDLSSAAAVLADDPDCARIAARTKDLALLSAAYDSLVGASYDDDEDALAHLADRLAEVDFFADASVFVDSFFSVTPVQAKILYHIFRTAAEVSVTFACLPADGDAIHLTAPHAFLSSMMAAADRLSRPYRITEYTENRRAAAAELRHLEANLWDFTAPPLTEPPSAAVRLISAADRYEEAEAVAARIAELVRAGARYGDIAVIARHIDPLRGILDTALRRNSIPYFLSARADIDTRPASRLMLCALSVISGGWRQEDVLLLAKTGLCGLTDDECDALQSYVETWHIRGARAFAAPWHMNPDGYVASVSARGQKLLALANDARAKLVPPLVALGEVFAKDGATVPEISRAMYELLCAFGVWDALHAEARRCAAAGDSRAASESGQMWDILMDCLDTLARTLPEATADASAYSALLRQVLAAAHVSAIPGGIAEVTVGEAQGLRTGEVSHVIVVGAVEGEFPASPADDGFFSDTDRVRLEGVGVVLSGTSDERMREELFWFYRAVALPHSTLTVMVPLTDGGTATVPSMAVERMRVLLPHLVCKRYDSADAKNIFSPASARAAVRTVDEITKAALSALGYAPPPPAAQSVTAKRAKVSRETAEKLFPGKISLTQTRLDSFVLCRFGYYCKYIAKIEEPREAELTAVNVGTFVHRLLELFFTRLGDRPLPLAASEMSALTDEIVATCVSEIVPEGGGGGRAAYLFSRLKRCVRPILTSLSREFAQSKFRPTCFELPVGTGGNGALPSMTVPMRGGRAVSLRGTIDRLDTWRDGEHTYIRVVDYKTGAKQFSPQDVKIGLNVQLLLYLFSVLRAPQGPERDRISGGADTLLPAGALYFSARPGETKSDVMISAEEAEILCEENIAKSGVLLADERVLSAMEADLAGNFIPAKKKKDGTFGKYAYSMEEIAALETEMCATVSAIGETMVSGDAAAVPRDPSEIHGQDACAYCAMKPICRAKTGKEVR